MENIIGEPKKMKYKVTFCDEPIKFKDIEIIQIGETLCRKNYEGESEIAKNYTICCITLGNGTLISNGVNYDFREGDVFITKKGQINYIKTNSYNILKFTFLEFNFIEQEQTSEIQSLKNFFDNCTQYVAKDRNSLSEILLKAIYEFYAKSSYFERLAETYIIELILLTYRNYNEKSLKPTYKLIENNNFGKATILVMNYIDDNILTLKGLSQIAFDLGYSDAYISRLFSEKTGITLQEYICYKKIEKAVELFKLGHLSVTKVSQALQYETIQSFSKAFKRVMGLSARDYIKQNLNIKETTKKNKQKKII